MRHGECVMSFSRGLLGCPPSLNRVYAVCLMKDKTDGQPISTQLRLIRLGSGQAYLSFSWMDMCFFLYCLALAFIKSFGYIPIVSFLVWS